MRRLEFRAWEHNSKRMIYNVSVRNSCIVNHIDTFYQPNHKTNYPIMQFTGLYDKNKRGIWEGDILGYEYGENDKEKTFYIVFHQGSWCLTYKHWENQFCKLDHFHLENAKVIGNIYENPELLDILT